jgi:serine/threonine-protein phosphatase 2A regulatory subunit B
LRAPRRPAPRQSGGRFSIRPGSKGGIGKRSPGEQPETQSDYASKLLHLAWHPEANVVACAASNSLYMYCA